MTSTGGTRKMLRGDDRKRWEEKNERLNAGHELAVGDRITDCWTDGGIVTHIDAWADGGEPSVENHGAVNVRRDDGSDEHYVHFGWRRNFRIDRAATVTTAA